MKLTLLHHTTQESAIQKIDSYLNRLMARNFPAVKITNPHKEWSENLMRFSFSAQKLFINFQFFQLQPTINTLSLNNIHIHY